MVQEKDSYPPYARLQELVSSASQSQNIKEGMDYLGEAFSLFSEETLRLEEAYSKLQQRFNDVNRQLEHTHVKLQEKVKQFDRVTYYLDSILRNINQGLLFVSHSGMITTYNLAAEKILGFLQRDILFKNFAEVFSDGCFGFSMQEALKNLSCPEATYVSYHHQGLEKELEVSTSSVFQKNKMQQGIILLIRDITEFREFQKREMMDKRMKELGEMAASVAHEIRNPLGGIEGFASLLYRDLKEQPELQKMTSHIIEGSKTISRLVENVLDHARPLTPLFTSCDIVVLIQEMLTCISVDPYFPQNVSVRFQSQHDSFSIALDKQMIRSALLHLLTNSCQAMPEGGSITISLHQKQDKIVIRVKDTGQGIEPKHLDRLFAPFFTTKPDGNGLGLYETYKIIQSHFGTIEVKSAVKQGTLFIITLPLRG